MNSVVSTFAVLFATLSATVVFIEAAGGNAACVADIALIVDRSGSIRNTNVAGRPDNYDLILQFLSSLVERVSIGPTKTRVAAVTYSDHAQLNIKLNQYAKVKPLQAAIKALPYSGGLTNTADALRLTRQEVFSGANGDRPDVKNIIVLITDGHSDDTERVAAEVSNVKGSGITVFGIGVTNGINEVELKGMVTAPIDQHYFKVDDFDKLMDVLENVIMGTCTGVTPATTTTPRPTVPVPAVCPTGKAGISSCKDRRDGDYQSCTTCKKYVSCVNGKMRGGKRKCAFAGTKQLVWDDKKKYCDYKSKTCSV